MKEYKQKNGNIFFITKGYRYYIINYKYHGFYYFIFNNNNLTNKGNYNMNIECSHWLVNYLGKYEFNYYL